MLKYIIINLKHSKSLQFETMNPNLNNWIRDKDNKDNKMKKKWQCSNKVIILIAKDDSIII